MGNKSKKTSVDRRVVVKWTEWWDDVFIDALLHQQSIGNRIDKVYTSAAYDNIVVELREKTGQPFEKDHLKNRLKTIKHNFNDCYDLFKDKSDMEWCPDTKMWRANPEVWKALIKASPNAKKWMTTPVANYNKLLLLFAKERATSNGVDINEVANGGVTCGNIAPSDSNGRLTCQIEVSVTGEELNAMNDGANQLPLPAPVDANSRIDSQVPSRSATSLKGKKRKAPMDEFESEFEIIRDALKDVADAVREGNVIAERGRARVYTEQEVFAELLNIGVDKHLRYRAYMFLIANADRVRAFFGLPAAERKEFLLHMMFSAQDS